MNDLSVTAVGPRLKQCGISRGAAQLSCGLYKISLSRNDRVQPVFDLSLSVLSFRLNGEDDDVELLLVERKNLQIGRAHV